MEELIEWLRVQLDADERVARRLIGATQSVTNVPNFYMVGGPAAEAYWVHFTPGRVLRLITAVRLMLDEFSWESREMANLMLLAEALYGDRPGYREEWRP